MNWDCLERHCRRLKRPELFMGRNIHLSGRRCWAYGSKLLKSYALKVSTACYSIHGGRLDKPAVRLTLPRIEQRWLRSCFESLVKCCAVLS